MSKSNFVTTTQGMSGWFAVIMWWNDEDPTMCFWEPWDTGVGRYADRSDAAAEAINLAKDLGIPYKADGDPMPKECQ